MLYVGGYTLCTWTTDVVQLYVGGYALCRGGGVVQSLGVRLVNGIATQGTGIPIFYWIAVVLFVDELG